MKIIKCVVERIREEIQDAETYINMAADWKAEQPEAAEVFAELSAEEMGHMEKLHEVVTELIRKYREENGEPPKGMLAIYEYMHQKNIEDAMRVKVKQAMFREA